MTISISFSPTDLSCDPKRDSHPFAKRRRHLLGGGVDVGVGRVAWACDVILPPGQRQPRDALLTRKVVPTFDLAQWRDPSSPPRHPLLVSQIRTSSFCFAMRYSLNRKLIILVRGGKITVVLLTLPTTQFISSFFPFHSKYLT